jgi:hypothetical protein
MGFVVPTNREGKQFEKEGIKLNFAYFLRLSPDQRILVNR